MPDFSDTSDCLNLSSALRNGNISRVPFDPSLESHLESFRVFLRTGNWGDVQFYCEHPYTDVPMTVLMKHALYNEGITRETLAERSVRIAARPSMIQPPALVLSHAEEREKRLAVLNELNIKHGYAEA